MVIRLAKFSFIHIRVLVCYPTLVMVNKSQVELFLEFEELSGSSSLVEEISMWVSFTRYSSISTLKV